MNYCFYVSGKATRLKNIIENDMDILLRTKVVFSDDSDTLYLKEKLTKYSIKYFLLDYKLMPVEKKFSNEYMSNELLKLLKDNNIDYCFSFGSHILKGKLLDEFKNKIINFHPSILPQFPGLKAIDRAIQSNTRYLGNTAHFIDNGVDTGPIIMQNIVLSDAFNEDGYNGVLNAQLDIINVIDQLLLKDAIKVINNKVFIKGANYRVSHLYPEPPNYLEI
ncbi:MAG: hypothetical protein K0S04_908 [Herbinix sp.]|jgi:phosphoribosylglycinamide formyltransferase-1|nr:hypothetical protein [Herbinix sp.]